MDTAISSWRMRLIFSLFLTFLTVSAALGQTDGTLQIQIKDPSGAVVKASGTLRNLDTKTDLPFDTNARGTFDFQNLPRGRYEIRVSKEGFSSQPVRVDVISSAPVSRTVTLSLRFRLMACGFPFGKA